MNRVPLLDIGDFVGGSPEVKARVARQFDQTCRDIGFLVLIGHGVPPSIREAAFRVMREFFVQPEAAKREVAATPDRVRGWRAFGATALARTRGDDTPSDLMERFTIGPYDRPKADQLRLAQSFLAENRWATNISDFEPTMKVYFQQLERLADTIMRIAALALELPENFFVPFFDRHITVLITNYYPRSTATPLAGQQRAGRHTDYNAVTILAPDPYAGGLQVEVSEGEWQDVPQVPESFVINIGDLMSRWTNDRWVSTMHRVVSPANGASAGDRLSLAFFHHPNDDAEIACLPSCKGSRGAKYPTVQSGAYLAQKVNSGWIGKTNAAYQPANAATVKA
jgi:isopenicillin N synthase-like dioxygenase